MELKTAHNSQESLARELRNVLEKLKVGSLTEKKALEDLSLLINKNKDLFYSDEKNLKVNKTIYTKIGKKRLSLIGKILEKNFS